MPVVFQDNNIATRSFYQLCHLRFILYVSVWIRKWVVWFKKSILIIISDINVVSEEWVVAGMTEWAEWGRRRSCRGVTSKVKQAPHEGCFKKLPYSILQLPMPARARLLKLDVHTTAIYGQLLKLTVELWWNLENRMTKKKGKFSSQIWVSLPTSYTSITVRFHSTVVYSTVTTEKLNEYL
jgi:hypothetical protein